jgi:DNA-binding HxlR family transcriptional regulator
MKKNELMAYSCPLGKAMSALGSKWKPIIVLVIKDRKLRFGELAVRINVISRKVLTDQLREMEADGLVIREEFKEIPPRVEYSLTEKGLALFLFCISWKNGKRNIMCMILTKRKIVKLFWKVRK